MQSQLKEITNSFQVSYLSVNSECKNKTHIKPYHLVKRIFEIIFCSFAIILVSPIILFFAFLIRTESKGNPFYTQERQGLNGTNFKMFKLRSMIVDAEIKGVKWTSRGDERITRVGKFIRKTRIDELPQLFNIIKGDMTFIGPRPEREELSRIFLTYIPNFEDRLLVKPGITGWAQVNGGYEISVIEKFKYDVEYIENENLMLDLIILFKTFRVILTGHGAR